MKRGSSAAGVCQDFAHILLAFLRAQNVICRYVAGLTTGEGASHAWVEVFDGETWIGVDPTHQRFCDDNYVKISQGPDFSFCALERGVFMAQRIKVCRQSVSWLKFEND